MKSGEEREVESGGVIFPTPVFDMCRGTGQLPTPGHVRSSAYSRSRQVNLPQQYLKLTLPSVCSHPATVPWTVQSQQAVVYSATM